METLKKITKMTSEKQVLKLTYEKIVDLSFLTFFSLFFIGLGYVYTCL